MERAFMKTGWVLRVMRDGGIYGGEYLAEVPGGFVVRSNESQATEYHSRSAAFEAMKRSPDPDRILANPMSADSQESRCRCGEILFPDGTCEPCN